MLRKFFKIYIFNFFRNSIEKLFMNYVLNIGDIDAANKLGVIFSLDPKLFEIAADAKLKSRNFAAAITLYKHSRVSIAFLESLI